MVKTKRHRDFILRWQEAPDENPPQGQQWSIEVFSERPRLMAKLGPRPHCFVAETRDRALAEAVGFIDSLSLP